MKKVLFLLIFLLAGGVGTNAYAIPFLDGLGGGFSGSIEGTNYVVEDRSGAGDVWDGTIGGYTGSDFTGYYIGTVTNDNNDSQTDLDNLIGYFLGDDTFSSDTYDKVDAPGTTNGNLTVSYAPDNLTGTWSTAGSDPLVEVAFYSIKGGNEYSLYYVNPALTEGDWTTRHILNPAGNQPAISHLSAVSSPGNSVPEPATMLLLGTGLIGLVGMRKKIKK